MTEQDRDWQRREFDRCWHWLAAAVDRYGPTHRKEHVWAEIESGKAQLWPTAKSAMVTIVESYPTGFREVKGWLAGGDLDEIKSTIPVIEAWAEKAGCDRAVILGRKGWARAFDYEPTMSVMVKELYHG